jgi:hypothetical protein
VLTLGDEVLELRSDSGVVFRLPVSKVVARFTLFGNMLISDTDDDLDSFTLSMYVNWTTPPPSPAQVDYLRQVQSKMDHRQQRSRWVMDEWRRSLAHAGAQVGGSRRNGLMYLVLWCIGGLLLAATVLTAAIVAAGAGG